MASLQAVETKLEELSQRPLSRDAFNQEAAAWLSTRPEFEAAGVDPSSTIWARFTDGRLLIIPNNLEPGPATLGPKPMQGQTSRAGPPGVRAPSANELPLEKQVRLLATFGPNFDPDWTYGSVSIMDGAFATAGYNPIITAKGNVTVESLRTVSGDGFFYLHTHGGVGITRGNRELYGLQTSTLVTDAKDEAFKDDLDKGRLVYATAHNGEKILGIFKDWDTRYAFTYLFVETYVRLGKDSMVWVNSCSSANLSRPGIASMVFAVQKAGAAVYFGWTDTIHSGIGARAVLYFTDRTLGWNKYDPEAPKQRPFDWRAILDWMRTKSPDGVPLTRDPWEGGELTAFSAVPGASGLLRPTIRQLQPSFRQFVDDEIIITGDFGSDPRNGGGPGGKVTITENGVMHETLTIVSWDPNGIVAKVPLAGPGSSGDVLVWVRDRKSNPRRLNAWRDKIVLVESSGDDRVVGNLKIEITLDLAFRADPDLVRKTPGGQPELSSSGVKAALGNAGSWTAGGSGSYVDAHGCQHNITWSGNGTLTFWEPTATNLTPPANNYFTFEVSNVNPMTKTIKMNVHAQFQGGTQLDAVSPPCPGGEHKQTLFPVQDWQPVELKLDNALNIIAPQTITHPDFAYQKLEVRNRIMAQPPYDPQQPKGASK